MGTPGDTSVVPARRSPYPRPWWLALSRVFLAFFAVALAPYLALEPHSFNIVRTLTDLRTLLWYVPLTGAGGWAFFDLLREQRALRARTTAERAQEVRQHLVKHWRRRLATARKKGDRQTELRALRNIAVWLQHGDRYDEATSYGAHALYIARILGDQPFYEVRNYGIWLPDDARYDEATPYLEATLSLARALGNQPTYEQSALYGLGLGALKRGDPAAAEGLFRQCLAVATTLGTAQPAAVVEAYANVGEFLCEYRGKREEGCQLLAQAQAMYHEIGQTRPGWLDDEERMRDLRRKYGDEGG